METLDINSLISDLALILILGAIATVVFKMLKQPVVLGYIVAGFLASPHFTALPTIVVEANIEFWAQIGIIVLLFSLGLEFSFKKLIDVGGSAIITALIIVLGMMSLGFVVGRYLGYGLVNSIFLGGIILSFVEILLGLVVIVLCGLVLVGILRNAGFFCGIEGFLCFFNDCKLSGNCIDCIYYIVILTEIELVLCIRQKKSFICYNNREQNK